jgi:branched-chain amino acid transport system permease protein
MDYSQLPQFLANGVVQGCVFGLLAVGFALVISVTQRFHVAFMSTFAAGAYGTIAARQWLHLQIVPAVLLGCLAAAALGVLLETCIYAPVARRAMSRVGDPLVPVLVVSLGFVTAFQGLLALVSHTAFLSIDLIEPRPVRFGSVALSSLDVATAAVSIVAVLLITAGLRWTRFGRTVRGVRANHEMATVVGVNVAFIYRCVFAIGSLGAGILGICAASKSGATPQMGFNEVFDAFVVAFVAGTARSPIRIGITGVIVGEIVSLASFRFGAAWSSLVLFGILIVYLSFEPLRSQWSWRPRARAPLRAREVEAT